MSWKKPAALRAVRVEVDPLHHSLLFRQPDEAEPSSCEILPLDRVSDVRQKPYTDESDEVLVSGDQLPRFIMLAYYEDQYDFVNVSFISLLADSEEVAAIWRQGLRSLVARNSLNSPRYIGREERLAGLYSGIVAKTRGGALPIKQ